jgi:hypothetical protein
LPSFFNASTSFSKYIASILQSTPAYLTLIQCNVCRICELCYCLSGSSSIDPLLPTLNQTSGHSHSHIHMETVILISQRCFGLPQSISFTQFLAPNLCNSIMLSFSSQGLVNL